MLSDRDLLAALEAGELSIDPLGDGQIQPASIDLRLGDTFAALPPDHPLFPGYIDPLEPPLEQHRVRKVEAGAKYPLPPHGFALGCTVETVSIGASLAGELAGKSSLARHGLVCEAAGFVDPGFAGMLTLELFNFTERTIMLTPGMRICQLKVHRLDSPAVHLYGSRQAGSRYQGQRGPTASRSHLKGGPCRARTRTSPSSSAASCAGAVSPQLGPGHGMTPSTTA